MPSHISIAIAMTRKRRDPGAILRISVRQLSSTLFDSDMMHTRLRELHSSCQEKGLSLTFERCKLLAIDMIQSYPQTVIVVDALDERQEDSRERLLGFLSSLPQHCGSSIKIFLSSRPEVDIQRYFSSWPRIEIRAMDNKHDISRYVDQQFQQQVDEDPDWKAMTNGDPALLGDIRHCLAEQSAGM